MPSKVDRKERKQLKVKTVGKPTTFGEHGEKVAFSCEDGLSYESFSKTLFEYIKAGAEFDADTELRIATGKDNKEYPHWVVTQIYIDGQPVAKAKAPFTGSKRDEDRTDTRTAVMSITELWKGGTIKESDGLVLACRIWMYDKLGVSVSKVIDDIRKMTPDERLIMKEKIKQEVEKKEE